MMLEVAKQRAEMLEKVAEVAAEQARSIKCMLDTDPEAVEALWVDYDFFEKWLISNAYNDVNDLLVKVGEGYEKRVS